MIFAKICTQQVLAKRAAHEQAEAAANAALEALLGTKRVVARHITRFTEGGAETAVRGRVDVLGGIEFSIDLAYAEGRCVGALRVQLAGLSPSIRAVARPLLAKLMRGRFDEERRFEEETLRELSASLTPPPCASGAASTAVPSVCASRPISLDRFSS